MPSDDLASALQASGVLVLRAGSTPEALNLVNQAEVDVVLVDVDHAADAIEGAPQLCGAPVVIRAERLRAEDLRGALRAGVRGWVSQHTSPAALVTSLSAVTRGVTVLSADWHEVLAQVVAPEHRTAPQVDRHALTRRETEIVRLVAQGYPNKQIARTLGIAQQTTKNQLHRIMVKAGVQSRIHLIRWAQEHDLVERQE